MFSRTGHAEKGEALKKQNQNKARGKRRIEDTGEKRKSISCTPSPLRRHVMNRNAGLTKVDPLFLSECSNPILGTVKSGVPAGFDFSFDH